MCCKLLNWNLTPVSRARLEAMRSLQSQMPAGSIVGSVAVVFACCSQWRQRDCSQHRGCVCHPDRPVGAPLGDSGSGCGVQGPVLMYTEGDKQNTFLRLRGNRCTAQLQVVSSS